MRLASYGNSNKDDRKTVIVDDRQQEGHPVTPFPHATLRRASIHLYLYRRLRDEKQAVCFTVDGIADLHP